MHQMLETVERFEELVQRGRDATPYEYATMFPAEGFWARRASKKRLALLRKIDESLRAMLWPEERVVFLTSGVLYSFAESYLVGGIIYYVNRRAIVLTTERIILMEIDGKQRPGALRSQVPLRSLQRIGRGGFGNTLLRLADGAKYVFSRVRRRDRKALRELAPAATARATARGAGAAAGLEHLCPWCFTALTGALLECPHCKGALKSQRKAALLSLLFPGLGNIYLGHRGMGAFELAFGALIWAANLLNPAVWSSPETLIGTVLAIVLVFHGIDAAATVHIARKGYYPTGEPPPGLRVPA
jgi:TM2 domain-containing membrane protein YozV